MIYEHVYIWSQNVNPYLLVLLGVIGFFIHFLPSLIAFNNRHKRGMAIFLLNVLFGWTGVVWIVLLIWALDNSEKSRI